MKKIPTVFVRNNPQHRSEVTPQVTPGCEWVLRGEGVATRKYDGSCCLVRDGRLYKRYEVKPGKQAPPDFEPVGHDKKTGKTVGWVPVGDGPEDRWHREAFETGFWQAGTHELVGPKIQGNPEGYPAHTLIPHDDAEVLDAPRDYDGLSAYLRATPYEGIVWHHPDGRMAKLKRRDFPKAPHA